MAFRDSDSSVAFHHHKTCRHPLVISYYYHHTGMRLFLSHTETPYHCYIPIAPGHYYIQASPCPLDIPVSPSYYCIPAFLVSSTYPYPLRKPPTPGKCGLSGRGERRIITLLLVVRTDYVREDKHESEKPCLKEGDSQHPRTIVTC